MVQLQDPHNIDMKAHEMVFSIPPLFYQRTMEGPLIPCVQFLLYFLLFVYCGRRQVVNECKLVSAQIWWLWVTRLSCAIIVPLFWSPQMIHPFLSPVYDCCHCQPANCILFLVVPFDAATRRGDSTQQASTLLRDMKTTS